MTCESCNIECSRFGKHRNGLQRFRCPNPECGRTYTEEHANLFGAMTISEDKAELTLKLLVEGMSIRSTERITGLHRDTIVRLLVHFGQTCLELMDKRMRDLRCRHIQSDEIWTYVKKKQSQVTETDSPDVGDAWVFVAVDAETKLVPSFAVGKRTMETTTAFIGDLAHRLANRIQLTTDGFHFYVEAVEEHFGSDIDFAQVVKQYVDAGPQDEEGSTPYNRFSRLSP